MDLDRKVVALPPELWPPKKPITEDDDSRKPDIMPIVLQNFPGTGVLAVHIHRAVGLSVPQYQAASKQPENSSSNVTPKTTRATLPISNRRSLPYAILECDGSEISIDAFEGTNENPDWLNLGKMKFDIARATELKIRLYARNADSHYKGSQDTLLGYAKMNPSFGDGNSHQMEWLPIENGTGKLLVESDYEPNRALQIETSKPQFSSRKHAHIYAYIGHSLEVDTSSTTYNRRYGSRLIGQNSPKLLSGPLLTSTVTKESKWTLGSFLFEMLTGLPPFYDEDAEQRRYNILSEPLERPTRGEWGIRNQGSSLFDGIDWEKVSQREYEPAFKPHECEMIFVQEKRRPIDKKSLEDQFSSWSWEPPLIERRPAVVKSPPIIKERTPVVELDESASENKEDWELIWQREVQQFYFYNHSTKNEKSIISNREKQSRKFKGGAAWVRDVPNANIDTSLPDATQSQEALRAVLENQYMHLIPTLLKEYSIDLNTQFQFGSVHTTPLNYVTGLEDVETKGNQELIEILVQRTDRIPCTRALTHAVSRKDVPIVNILLANGVKCDFEDSDRPAGPGPCVLDDDWDLNATMGDASEPDEYIPPLVRATFLGDVHFVQLLLAYGADANIGYHDLHSSMPGFYDISEQFHMRCGRPIQLAMELGHRDVVQLLLSYGADIDLAQPVWQHHHCKMIPRAARHEIIAQLRSVVASVAV
ncbi:serine/threonine-protein kinase ypk, putative [Talaromyces stipitatus ATCC 10500]|uniref:Serine/threonine-protein kinase ypk, putative n=1 Tax=Talaromyces stipitatus (strain ATCC 10500 / CBS 375.48 / QM 6759 / NRRL 1006) TaxID=441959 RepID=B8LUX9_TALSN|nr:serine/threonine-protein kinase ypk, putative [Talaromyces stipitatus ATCC 10500]EED22600.1 serine/threonine-protein kinase ypk, putative [Talaromyces stipitatus ATCC 10500]